MARFRSAAAMASRTTSTARFGRQLTGYLRQPSGEVILDSDEQVQSAIRLIFEKFGELGTGRQVLQVLEPAAVELALEAEARIQREQDRLEKH